MEVGITVVASLNRHAARDLFRTIPYMRYSRNDPHTGYFNVVSYVAMLMTGEVSSRGSPVLVRYKYYIVMFELEFCFSASKWYGWLGSGSKK